MIILEKVGTCKKCPNCELKIDRVEIEDFNGEYKIYEEVQCIHRSACHRAFHMGFNAKTDKFDEE